MKLITGAAVLQALGPDYRYRTEVSAAGPVRVACSRARWSYAASAIPTISGRFDADPRDRFRAFADSLRARGINRVAGGIIGVDSAFVDGPLGSGWAWDDVISSYAAEFGALQFNEGAIRSRSCRASGRRACGGDPGSRRAVRLGREPHADHPAGRPTRISVQRDAAGPGLIIMGEIGAGSDFFRRAVAIRNPTLFFLGTMRETLREAGVTVEGPVIDADDLDADDLSVAGDAALHLPLRATAEVVTAMMKPSQNQIAETLLRTAGLELRGEGSARAGAAVADSIFALWDLPRTAGSPTARGCRATTWFRRSSTPGCWSRWRRSPERRCGSSRSRSRAWTGRSRAPAGHSAAGEPEGEDGNALRGAGLSGYMTTRSGERIVFSALVNNHVRSAAAADRVIDGVLLRIYEMR
jgi:serine-type D-Ala-D-Ala carboxypeptidase/endopeptidase (penicillin-binding protein 4)